jgi:hypothetical protein
MVATDMSPDDGTWLFLLSVVSNEHRSASCAATSLAFNGMSTLSSNSEAVTFYVISTEAALANMCYGMCCTAIENTQISSLYLLSFYHWTWPPIQKYIILEFKICSKSKILLSYLVCACACK